MDKNLFPLVMFKVLVDGIWYRNTGTFGSFEYFHPCVSQFADKFSAKGQQVAS